MKKILIKCVATATMILLAASCGKGDGDAEYGNSFVYIPQATQSGGLNIIILFHRERALIHTILRLKREMSR